MILVHTPNPALDLTWRVDHLVVGESQRASGARVRAGGKGINVARVIHQLGGDVLAIAAAGGRTGREFERELRDSGVRHLLIPAAAETRRTVTIVDSNSGHATVINEYGTAQSELDRSTALDTVTAHFERSTLAVISGSMPPETPVDFIGTLIESAHQHRVPVIVDTSGEHLLAAAAAGADLLKPNAEEAMSITGCESPESAAGELLSVGARQVVISLGRDGLLWGGQEDPSRFWRARLTRPVEGNPTGAGDAVVASLALSALGRVDGREMMLRRAAAIGAAAVLQPLAGEISARHTELLDDVEVWSTPSALQEGN